MSDNREQHNWYLRPAGIFFLCAFLIVLSGYVLFENIKAHEKGDTNKTLVSVGQIKASQIQAYLAERKGGATVVASFLGAPEARRWLAHQTGSAPATLKHLSESVVKAYQYRGLLLLDANADTRLAAGHGGMLTGAGKAIALRAMRERTPASFQIYFGDPSAPDVPVLDTFVPVMSTDGARAVGMIVLRSHLNFLFSLVQTWPTKSETAELLLVTREGSDVLFLNELRHQKDTALKLRVPLSTDTSAPAWPAILAVTGHYGLFEANDYRGRRILAYTLPVPDTSWGIVVKMDIEEAVTHSQGLLKTTVAVVAIFIAFVGAVVWQWWRRDKAERQANRQLQEAQFRLLQSEAVLNEAQQLVHLGSWELDLVADSLTWSNESFYIFEVDPDRRDISYQTFVSIVHPDDRDFVDRAYTTSVREKSTYDIEHRLLFADGRIKWVHERCVTFYDEDGKPLRSVGTTQDITERKRMEENLRGSEMKFRALYESSSDAIMLLDEKGFFDCNEAALRMFGCATHDDFINKHPSELSPPTQPGGQDSVSLADERIAEAFRNGSNRFEWVHCRLDGTEFFSEVSLSSMTLDGRRILQATVRDITGRKQAEEKLRKYNEELEAINHQLRDTKNLLLQSDKMASIGQLAAGVAHEINNPIGYVNSNLGTLDGYLKNLFEVIATYKEMEDTVADSAALARVKAVKDKVDLEFLKEDVLSLMDESREGITRVKKIVQDLKDFSRVDAGDEWHRANLHQGLDSTLNVARNEIKYKADVKKEYGGIPDVECLPSQLNQVFMNLLVNAAHAIEERGTITIRTGSQGDEVWVEVEDTGKGIAPEHIGKIFEPFFTTKPVGQGTGLGLSLSYGIIQKHHGRIEVKSEVGKGTSFKVWLPARQPQELPGRGEEKLT